jgi:hypothetical protein
MTNKKQDLYIKRLASILRSEVDYGYREEVIKIEKELGTVKYKTPSDEGVLVIYFAHMTKPAKYLEGCSFRTTDGEFQIGLGSAGIDYFLLHGISDSLVALIAHELGHHLSGHLLPDSDYSKDKLTSFREEPPLQPNDWIWLATKFHLGECREAELEADIIAAKFMGLLPVLTIHAINSIAYDDLGNRIELNNRMKKLRELYEAGELNGVGYSLEVDLTPLEKMYRIQE